MTVRGVKIPRSQIEEIERLYSCRHIPDEQGWLIYSLDRVLNEYYSKNNKYPEAVELLDVQGYYFRPMPLKIGFLGGEVPGPRHKPAWFRFNKGFVVK